MALYEELLAKDYMRFLVPSIREGIIELTSEGKFKLGDGVRMSDPTLTWIFTKKAPDRNCFLWEKIYFMLFKMIPRECFNCYKIVTKPKNVKQLFKLADLQEKLGLPAKCGIDTRGYNRYGGIYSGFWYAPLPGGLEGAKDLFTKISRDIISEVGFGLKTFLKRGCTEFENTFGASDKWQSHPMWEGMQNELDSLFDIKDPEVLQPELYKRHIKITWLGAAFERGDELVKEFVDKYPESFGVSPAVKYMEG